MKVLYSLLKANGQLKFQKNGERKMIFNLFLIGAPNIVNLNISLINRFLCVYFACIKMVKNVLYPFAGVDFYLTCKLKKQTNLTAWLIKLRAFI